MRVVVVSAWEPWRASDGAAFVLGHQLRILGARHDISVLAAGAPSAVADPPPSASRELPGVRLRWFGSDRGAVGDQVVRRAESLRTGEPAHVGYVERPALLGALQAELAGGVDLVHLHGWGTAALWSRVGAVPTVHVAVDPWAVNAGNRRRSAMRERVEREQLAKIVRHEREHYPKLGAVVVVTPRDAELVNAAAPGCRVEVIPNGVEPGDQPVNAPAAPLLGFHGVFDSQANVDAARNLVLGVLPLVRREVPAARVLLVGRRPPAEVLSLAGHDVEVVGDAEDLRSQLDRMTVHVDWMTSGTGLKNKVLEAMAAGRPVVTNELGSAGIGDVGGIGGVSGAGREPSGIADVGGIVVAVDLEAAAAAVVRLLADRALAAEVGGRGRARVIADFSWEANAEQVEALWTELLARSAERR